MTGLDAAVISHRFSERVPLDGGMVPPWTGEWFVTPRAVPCDYGETVFHGAGPRSLPGSPRTGARSLPYRNDYRGGHDIQPRRQQERHAISTTRIV